MGRNENQRLVWLAACTISPALEVPVVDQTSYNLRTVKSAGEEAM